MPDAPGHWAVIMARGDSRRMGQPKGAVRFAGGGPCFLERVESLYRELGWPRLLVVRRDLEVLYRSLVAPDARLSWLPGEGGLGTAHTLQLAYRALVGQIDDRAWLWAHPVDVPLVKPSSLRELARAAEGHPGQVIRPLYRGRPGHPVAIPATLLARWFPPDAEPVAGPMRQLCQDAPVWSLDTHDASVVLDFDEPGSLKRAKE